MISGDLGYGSGRSPRAWLYPEAWRQHKPEWLSFIGHDLNVMWTSLTFPSQDSQSQ